MNRHWRDTHRERDRASRAVLRARTTMAARVRRDALLREQDGCCYLCGEGIALTAAVVDHDHRCCPEGRSCTTCRRGVACHRCNKVIGMAVDSPDLLRYIADNLELALADASDRLAAKPTQAALELTP